MDEAEHTQEERDAAREARDEAKRLHDNLDLLGLRAQATAVGLVQLSKELLRAGIIDDAAVTRIKDAIAKDIIVARTSGRQQKEFEDSVHRRLNALFPKKDELDQAKESVGPVENAQALSDRGRDDVP